ncbi:MAG TPA: lytic transglycosylase domain-containing protein [Acidisoma sp.]|jgi:soluble lytic murein transglycosylase-like protein|uniref:lytic transglycosylase domain-containing protein n=1 Tax=Acidisoma sp. TaxID=1872115 RepID=UPI002C113052|nr:lytic transglycosylase domain-containing protein [Acidisoma sp.]HTI00734.1 lytic transglycosylase domain-containing protein [Acidisoma sp.]
MPIPYHECMVAAEAAYHLPVRALPAIQRVEGGKVGTVSPNKDGSHDLGLMQVNTRWVTPLARSTGLPPQTVVTRLIFNPCFNIAAAASILRTYVDEEHGDMWRAIGDYHSHTPWLSTPYKLKVMQEAMKLPHGAAVQKPVRRKHRKPEDLASD